MKLFFFLPQDSSIKPSPVSCLLAPNLCYSVPSPPLSYLTFLCSFIHPPPPPPQGCKQDLHGPAHRLPVALPSLSNKLGYP